MEEVLDFYSDALRIHSNAWGLALIFGARPIGPIDDVDPISTPQAAEPKAVVRMSHLHAKVAVMLLRRVLRSHEEKLGTIEIPTEIRSAFEITEADWD